METEPAFWSPGAVQAEAKVLSKARNTLKYILPEKYTLSESNFRQKPVLE
jgi:hypothetical protein